MAEKTPTRFFFRCRNYSEAEVSKFISRHGKDILIGVDPGLESLPEPDVADLMRFIASKGAKLHVYLVGPGSLEWSEDEAEQIKDHARSIGIDVDGDHDWHEQWLHGTRSWETKLRQLLLYYWDEWGIYSFEIDNLDQVWDQDPAQTVLFYQRLAKFLKDEGIGAKLVMKNLTGTKQLHRVFEEVTANRIPVSLFAPWAMFEEGSGNEANQIAICKAMSIRAITPTTGIRDTHDYGVVDTGIPLVQK